MPYKFVARPGSVVPGPGRDLTDEEAVRFKVTDSAAYEYVESETDTTTTDTADPLPEEEE